MLGRDPSSKGTAVCCPFCNPRAVAHQGFGMLWLRSPTGSTRGSNCRHRHRQEGQAEEDTCCCLLRAQELLEKMASAGGWLLRRLEMLARASDISADKASSQQGGTWDYPSATAVVKGAGLTSCGDGRASGLR
ncbi:hypothetical protein GRJ2_002467200 [Grus japonensis]|uniref:Uncharacterized protein n=1 Tax=Grus japonensis TaxID=30415 RepID=A0ABC9XQL6_GRUJA